MFRVFPLLCALLALVPVAAVAQPMGDGTTSEEWTLDNGLHVVVRNVPGTSSVAVIVAYGVGSSSDPAGSEGFARLMAESAFFAAAGEGLPRTRSEMDELRPIGWNVQVERKRTELAEMTSKERFPATLRQVATRMRGVNITDDIVAKAREAVTAEFQRQYVDDLGARLYAEIGVRAAGGSRASMDRWIRGEGIAEARARDVARRVEELYVPANAVLSLAGDFTGINLRAFTEREFGGIPAGTKYAAPSGPAAKAFKSDATTSDAPRALGGVGLLAPAIADSSHPSFYLSALMLGTHASIQWGRPNSPLTSRFHYSIFDDPSAVRFYPPIRTKSWSAQNLSVQLAALAEQFNGLNIDYESVMRVQQSVEWLLGGPLPEALRERVKTEPPVLYRLASSAAARRLIGDAGFWTEYRRRFDPTVGSSYGRWHPYILNHDNHAGLMYLPPN